MAGLSQRLSLADPTNFGNWPVAQTARPPLGAHLRTRGGLLRFKQSSRGGPRSAPQPASRRLSLGKGLKVLPRSPFCGRGSYFLVPTVSRAVSFAPPTAF